eukprot:RCo028415
MSGSELAGNLTTVGALRVLWEQLYVPHSLQDAGSLARVLSGFTATNYFTVMYSLVILYIFLQTFSIPGTIFINVLCGSLFGLPVAFVLTLLCATAGASASYVLSRLFGRPILLKFFPERVRQFSREVELHHNNLFSWLLFLRISPFLPNWFINVASPVLRIPYPIFAAATFLGIAPQTFIAVNAGSTVTQITDPHARLFTVRTWLTLVSVAMLALLPMMFRWVRKRRLRLD